MTKPTIASYELEADLHRDDLDRGVRAAQVSTPVVKAFEAAAFSGPVFWSGVLGYLAGGSIARIGAPETINLLRQLADNIAKNVDNSPWSQHHGH